MDGKLLSGINSMYANSIAYIRVKGGESEYFRIEKALRQVCIMCSWLFNVYMNTEMKKVKMGMGRMGVRFVEEGGNCLTSCMWLTWLCLVSQKGHFIEVCRIRSLKVNANKRKGMVLGGEERLESGIHVDGARLEQVSEFI